MLIYGLDKRCVGERITAQKQYFYCTLLSNEREPGFFFGFLATQYWLKYSTFYLFTLFNRVLAVVDNFIASSYKYSGYLLMDHKWFRSNIHSFIFSENENVTVLSSSDSSTIEKSFHHQHRYKVEII